MKKISKKVKVIITIAAILLVFIVFMVISANSTGALHKVYNAISSPVTSIQKAFSSIGTGIRTGFHYLFNAGEVTEYIEKLEEENASYKDIVTEKDILQRENKELKAMLEFKEKYTDYNIVGGEVIAGDLNEMFNTFTINLGTSDGIQEGDFVINSYGLLGVVKTAGPVSSKVVSILDEQNKMIARTLEGNEMVRVTGTYDDEGGKFLNVDRIPEDSTIDVGDMLVTSNAGSVYPYGIKIGKVIKVGEADGIKYAVAEPAADFKRITKVFVLTPKYSTEDE